MSSSTRPIDVHPSGFHPKDIAILGLCTALLLGAQVALAVLPNIEIVTLLVLLYTLYFGRKTLMVIYGFALLEGMIYGFSVWWIMYLYVWTLLFLVVTLFRKNRSVFVWAMIAGGFGITFGFLCALPYLFLGGLPTAVAWWIAGIPFDLIHCAANFILVLILFRPLDALFGMMRQNGIISPL